LPIDAARRPATVLIAGSDTMMRTRLAAAVSNLGFPVITAADEREAWAAFGECAPALVISHWDRSDFDALDLCRRVRDAAGDDCFVLIVTSREEKTDLAQAVAAGVDDYMWAPIDGDRFGARLVMAEERLHRRHAKQQPAPRVTMEIKRGLCVAAVANEHPNLGNP
jgi:sigma-B regulation protein RsbU (phosphoserine phosphatase)